MPKPSMRTGKRGSKRRLKASPPLSPPRGQARLFPIVGIGSSAGGLEALDLFLRHCPTNSGIAFVIIQHLEPTQKSSMAELLGRATTMKVIQVKDQTPVQPNSVYVIPPNKEMSILHGVLYLLDRVASRGPRLPIDLFFHSLADDQQERGIGVILSGMGSDGTMGLGAIKEKGGASFVQEPSSAKCGAMPKSVIDAGLADFVAPAESLPAKIITYLNHPHLAAKSELAQAGKAHGAIEKILILLRQQTGHDFSLYKNTSTYRRIERRMTIHRIDKIALYVRYLQENPQEVRLLFKELLIGVTRFFRDASPWQRLKTELIPLLFKGRGPGSALRAWVIGCSTGEEAYSLAIILKEALDQLKTPSQYPPPQIFATDLDSDAVEKARSGLFSHNIAADISPERLERFFIPVEHGYQIKKVIRDMVIFAVHNLVMDPPFTKMDLVSCRNLLIYLSPHLQKRLIPVFHYSLNPDGILLLGNSETIGEFTDHFRVLDDRERLYSRKNLRGETRRPAFPPEFMTAWPTEPQLPTTSQPVNLQSLADTLLLQEYSPAAVLVNERGDILYINGRTGKYLEPAMGKVNWNIFAMAREGLRYQLSNLFQKALRQKEAVTMKNVEVKTNGDAVTLNIICRPISEPEGLKGLIMIVFSDVATPPKTKLPSTAKRHASAAVVLAQIEKELQQSRQETQIARDEMQIFQEEARSANEELQSTNEELQSTNEEIQSTNEEMQTLNHELKAKVDDLSRANNDMKNLLDSTELTTLFLDNSLNVRLFTTGSNKVFKLIPGDVGRPITDLASDLFYPELSSDAREVLRTLLPAEKEVTTRTGLWFLARTMPYRTLENVIEGVVITFTDITASKALAAELNKAQTSLNIAKNSPKT